MNMKKFALATLVSLAALPSGYQLAWAAPKKAAAPAESAPYQGVVELSVNGVRSSLERQPALYPKLDSGVFTLTPSMYYEFKGASSPSRIAASSDYYFVARSLGPSVDPSQLFKLYAAEPKKKKSRRVKISKNEFGKGMQIDAEQNMIPLRFEQKPNSVLRIYPAVKLQPGEYVFISTPDAFAFGID